MNDLDYHDLLLMGTACHYDLTTEAGRAASNRNLVDFFLAFQRRLKPEVSFEIGAFEAQFSVRLKKLLPQTCTIAFEANPYNYALYKDSSEIKEAGIEYLHAAITDKNGEVEFLVQKKLQEEKVDGSRGNNSLLPRTESGVEYEKLKVPATTLKNFIRTRGLQNKSFTAWIDVEGAAKGVLQGGGAEWKNCSALMIEVEQHPYWKGQWLFWDVAEFLMKRGFVPIARDFEYEYQFNVVFLKKALLRDAAVRDGYALYHSYLAKNRHG